MFQKAPFPFSINANGTQKFLSIKCFSKKWGWARRAHASAKRLPPLFGKKFYLKKLLCIVCVCKKWHCRFFEAFDLPQYESVRVWAFLACKKIEIRVMWTFTVSKKENPCSFLRVRSSAKKIAFVFRSIFKLWKYKGFVESNPNM